MTAHILPHPTAGNSPIGRPAPRCKLGDVVVILAGKLAGRMGTVVSTTAERAHDFSRPEDIANAMSLDWVVQVLMPSQVCFHRGRVMLTNHFGYRDSALRPIRDAGEGAVEDRHSELSA